MRQAATFEPLSLIVLSQVLQEKHRVGMQSVIAVWHVARVPHLGLFDKHLLPRPQARFNPLSPQLLVLECSPIAARAAVRIIRGVLASGLFLVPAPAIGRRGGFCASAVRGLGACRLGDLIGIRIGLFKVFALFCGGLDPLSTASGDGTGRGT